MIIPRDHIKNCTISSKQTSHLKNKHYHYACYCILMDHKQSCKFLVLIRDQIYKLKGSPKREKMKTDFDFNFLCFFWTCEVVLLEIECRNCSVHWITDDIEVNWLSSSQTEKDWMTKQINILSPILIHAWCQSHSTVVLYKWPMASLFLSCNLDFICKCLSPSLYNRRLCVWYSRFFGIYQLMLSYP